MKLLVVHAGYLTFASLPGQYVYGGVQSTEWKLLAIPPDMACRNGKGVFVGVKCEK